MLTCVADRALAVRDRLGGAITASHPRLRERWLAPNGWAARLDDVAVQASQPRELRVALAGSTGAGKSTLLNALLGSRVLPVSTVRPCTAAITELRWADLDGFRVRVRFTSRAHWEDHLRAWSERLAGEPRDRAGEAERLLLRQQVLDTLGAAYGAEAAERFVGGGGRRVLVEPPRVARALDQGAAERTAGSTDQLRSLLGELLDASSTLWPVVETVEVAGRFDLPDPGLVLVDLPGLNDPNAGREAVARRALTDAQVVLVVFNTARGLTRDVVDVLVGGGLVSGLLLGRQLTDLAFVGTHGEVFDPDAAAEELDLDPGTPLGEVASARNRAVETEVRRQLATVARRVADRNQAAPDEAAALDAALARAPVLVVAAGDHLRLLGVGRGHPVCFDDPTATGVPALDAHLLALGARLGVRGSAVALDDTIDRVIVEVRRSRSALLGARARHGDGTRLWLAEAMAPVLEALDVELQRATDAMSEQATVILDDADGRLAEVAGRVPDALRAVVAGWDGLPPATLHAASARGGRTATTDLTGTLTDALVERFLPTWSAVTDPLAAEPRRAAAASLEAARRAVAELLEAAAAAGVAVPPGSDVSGVLAELAGPTASSVDASLQRRLREAGFGLDAALHPLLERDLAGAYRKAAKVDTKATTAEVLRLLRQRVRVAAPGWAAAAVEGLEEHLADGLAAAADELRLGLQAELRAVVAAAADDLQGAAEVRDVQTATALDRLASTLVSLPPRCTPARG